MDGGGVVTGKGPHGGGPSSGSAGVDTVAWLGMLFSVQDWKAYSDAPISVALKSLWHQVLVWVALTIWLGIFHFNTVMICGALIFLPHPVAIAVLVIYCTLILIPVDESSPLGRQLGRFIATYATEHFPLKIIFEDKEAIDPKRAHVVALEPHSVLPICAIAFTPGAELTAFTNARVLASTTLTKVPLARHLLAWLGMAAVDRPTFRAFLQQGVSCVLVPGGVQECLYMNTEKEVLFLRGRRGFLKLAMEEGAPLVPAFCFGQRNIYHFWYPKREWFYKLARKMKFAPLVYWGLYGGPLPFPHPMTLVFGKPIEVQKREAPSDEEVTALQGKFIDAMRDLYERNKEAAGASDVELVIM